MRFMARYKTLAMATGATLLSLLLTASSPPPPQTVTAASFVRSPPLVLATRETGKPKPLVVLVETNPWLMVTGSDSPSFALYDDGQAIYLTDGGYKTVKLDDTELSKLIDRLDLGTLACLNESYDPATATDQPTETLTIFNGDRRSSVSVYGSMKSPSVRSKIPEPFVSAYDMLRAFHRPDARDWLPDKIEVMVWPYEYAPGTSIIWPKNWPALDDASTVKRGDSYSIFVPAADYPALTRFLGSRQKKGAVEIGGKKWAVSTRFPFSGERDWMTRPTNDGAASACPNPHR